MSFAREVGVCFVLRFLHDFFLTYLLPVMNCARLLIALEPPLKAVFNLQYLNIKIQDIRGPESITTLRIKYGPIFYSRKTMTKHLII